MVEYVFQLILAVVIGGIIGSEREFRTGTGLRTMMLVCLGATMFTIFSEIFAEAQGDPRRIAAAVVTGVGFLGAGMILRHRGGVLGLTTAATVWLVAALGMGIAMRQYLIVVTATVLVLFVLWALPRMRRLTNARKTVTYEVVTAVSQEKYQNLVDLLTINNLEVSDSTTSKKADSLTTIWQTYGTPSNHEKVSLMLLSDEDIVEVNIH